MLNQTGRYDFPLCISNLDLKALMFCLVNAEAGLRYEQDNCTVFD